MTDKKVSDETAAAALTGTELVRIVQGGASVRSTVADMALAVADADATMAANSDSKVPTQKAVKSAIAGAVTGYVPRASVRAGTTAALAANTYANGTAGVGATLTGNANGALAAQDGVTLVVNDRLLVMNEAAAANNGPYALTQVGDATHPYILTRVTDCDQAAELPLSTFLITEGTTHTRQKWTIPGGSYTIGTTAITLVQTDAQSGDAMTNTSVSVDGEAVLFNGTTGKSLKRATGTGYPKLTAGVQSVQTAVQLATDLQGDGLGDKQAGFRNIPQFVVTANRTTIAAEAGCEYFHPASDGAVRTVTIDKNATMALPIGATFGFSCEDGAQNLLIGIDTDTLIWAGQTATGTRTLGANGYAVARKLKSTKWQISGINLT